jgi:Fanconi anemia group M protein
MASWDDIGECRNLLNLDGMEPRGYQVNIAKSVCGGSNSLVVLPTGLGKTMIAMIAIAQSVYSGKKAIMLSPTKPLSEQHYATALGLLNMEKELIMLLTGSMPGRERRERENEAKVIIATPQTVANDIKSGRLSLDGFGVVVFDECHRAVGKYAYTYIADECKLRGIQLIGLTASPGSRRDRVKALVAELGVENIEIRTSADTDVAPYVMDKTITTIMTEKNSQMDAVLSKLKSVIDEHMEKLYRYGLSPFKTFENMPKGRFLQVGDNISRLQAQNYKHMATFNYVYVLNLTHAYDLLSTEGFDPFIKYFESLEAREKKSRVLNSILGNPSVRSALIEARGYAGEGVEHPKVFKIIELLGGRLKDKTIIIFAQYRSTIKMIVKILNQYGIPAESFVGKKEGVTQAGQKVVIERFRAGEFRVLVSTSIGEEGLDIPSVDAVVFYEPIPSEIRNIQRKGRAGRIKLGEIVMLVTKGTKDEVYLMISRIKEKRMHELVAGVKKEVERRAIHEGADVDNRQRYL